MYISSYGCTREGLCIYQVMDALGKDCVYISSYGCTREGLCIYQVMGALRKFGEHLRS